MPMARIWETSSVSINSAQFPTFCYLFKSLRCAVFGVLSGKRGICWEISRSSNKVVNPDLGWLGQFVF